MASIYRRKDSQYWWLKYRQGGKWIPQSTGLRVDSEQDTREAELLRAQWALKESKESGRASAKNPWSWVETWMEGHCKSPKTLETYRLHWKHLQHWMAFEGIHEPADVSFRHGQAYVTWRTGRRANKKQCSKNCALMEIKTMGLILRHAALRGEITMNPLQKLGIARDPYKTKREFTDAELQKCLDALPNEDEWLRLSFLIAFHTGCRLRETRLNMRLVDFDLRTITFETPKGGEIKAYTRPLPAALIPVLKPLKRRKYSHEIPFQPSRCFQNFFQRVGIEGVSLHCLRVSYVTRLHRAGVPLVAAMRLVNHSSEVVHRVYRRLNVEDVRQYADVPLLSTKPQNRPS